MNFLMMRDFVTLSIKAAENKKRLFECKDSKETSGHKLLVHVAATHSGVVNGNLRFYRPDYMRDGLHTWTPEGRIPAPALVHHDPNQDAVGRVMSHKYVDLSQQYLNVSGFSDNYFCDAKTGAAKKSPVYDSVDWIVRNLQEKNDDYEGLGYTELGLKITNPDSIRKVLDGEYAGVSVGFGTDAAVCSICHTDWARDNRCEHKMGRRYDSKLAFLISGRFRNKEISFVNFPADPFATVRKTEVLSALQDSMPTRLFFLGLPRRQQAEVLEVADSLELDDSLLVSDIELITEAEMDAETTEKTDFNLDELIAQVKGELTKDSALELQKTLGGLGDLSVNDARRAKRALVKLDKLIRDNNWDNSLTKESVEARIAGFDAALAAVSEQDRAAFTSQLETDAAVFGLDFKAPAREDGTEKAATKTDGSGLGTYTDEIAKTLTFADSEHGKSLVAALNSLESAFTAMVGAEEDNVYAARSAVYTLWEKLCAGSSLEYLKKRLSAEDSADMLLSRDEYQEMHDEVVALDSDVKKLQANNQILQNTNLSLIKDQRTSLAKVVVLGRRLTGVYAKDVVLADKVGELSARSLASLNDAVTDLLESLPADLKFEDKTPPAAETAKEISDNASIDANKEQPGETDSADPSEKGEVSETHPVNLPIGARDLRKRLAILKYSQLNS